MSNTEKSTKKGKKTVKNVKKRVFLHAKICVVCGVAFNASRTDAKFCSSKCTKHHAKFILPKEIIAQQESQKQAEQHAKKIALEFEILENQKTHQAQKHQKELNILAEKEKLASVIDEKRIKAFAETKAQTLAYDLAQKRQHQQQRRIHRFEVLAQHRKEMLLSKINHFAHIETLHAKTHAEHQAQERELITKQNALLASAKQDFDKIWEKSPEFQAFVKRQQEAENKPLNDFLEKILKPLMPTTQKKTTSPNFFAKKVV